MNKSEKVAYEYIKSKGYAPHDISYNYNSNPDFVVQGTKGFEAKNLYGNTLVFTDNQFKELHDETTILVVAGGKVIEDMNFKNIKSSKKYNIKVYEQKYSTILVRLDTAERLEKFAKDMGLRSKRDGLEFLLNDYIKNPNKYRDVNQPDSDNIITFYVDDEMLGMINDSANFLADRGLISEPKSEMMAEFAIMQTIKGLVKSVNE